VCNLGESKLGKLARSNFRGMKIHRQWKSVRKLRKSCGVKVWKLAGYFEVSEWIILRILTWRLFPNFRHVCERPSGLRAAGSTVWRSTLHLLCSVSCLGLALGSSVASRIFASPSSPMPGQDSTTRLTSTDHNHPVYNLLSKHTAVIWHLPCKRVTHFSLYNMR
jgi:hypothetical protein